MNKKELLKKVKFFGDVLNIFDIYSSCLDDYFKIEKNRLEHKELYDYYKQLVNNLNNLVKGNK